MKWEQVYLFLIGTVMILSCSDHPKQLSGKIETIEVDYLNWACDCPDFVEIEIYKNYDNTIELDEYYDLSKDCIFITPSNAKVKIPDSYYIEDHYDYHLRLTGQFYIDEGIPHTYEMKTPEKPKKARVFCYDHFEFVKK